MELVNIALTDVIDIVFKELEEKHINRLGFWGRGKRETFEFPERLGRKLQISD